MRSTTGALSAALLLLLTLIAPSRPASAAIAYLWPAGQAGNQAFSGSIGMDFAVNTPIEISSLGVFDHLGDGISGTLTATIWDLATQSPVPGATASFTNADPGILNGSARLKPISAITLAPGLYSIASAGHNAIDLDYNPATNTTTNSGGGAISITNGRRFRGDGSGNFPDVVDSPGFYGGGTFEFSGVAIPPATYNGDLIAYQVNAPQPGIQDFSGSVGMDFVVNQPIFVTALGAFDADQNTFIRPITVELYARNDGGTPDPGDDTGGAILLSQVFDSSAGQAVGGSRFVSLASRLRLDPGAYTINAHGYGVGELLANSGIAPINKQTNDGDGAISFVGTSRFCFAGGPCTTFPFIADGGPADRYASGTFAFEAVPEPSTWALVLCGLALVAVFRRRR
jgi:hypothetical protein